MSRRILHLDMDAFYASVEQADFPEFKGKPVIVGGGSRGVVAAASYEARKFGIRSAMPMFQALKRCPEAVVRPVRMGRYKDVSRKVMAVLRAVSPLVEQVSIDEAFVDVSGTEGLFGPPEALARSIKGKILDATGLTCSIGIAPSKLVAKIASDFRKPDGLSVVSGGDVAAFMRELPAARLPGVGARSVEVLERLGVRTAGDVLRFSPEFWRKRFGKHGLSLYEKAAGKDDSPVAPVRVPKSFGAEDTFPKDASDREILEKWLWLQSERVGRDLREHGLQGRTVTLKIKFADFRQITRSRSLSEATDATDLIFQTAGRLLAEANPKQPVRLCGVSVSNLERGPRQMRLFQDPSVERLKRLDRALDAIRDRHGPEALRRGRVFDFES